MSLHEGATETNECVGIMTGTDGMNDFLTWGSWPGRYLECTRRGVQSSMILQT